MKATFPHALSFVLKSEGGYSNLAADSGGATNFGITHLEYDAYRRSKSEAPRDVRAISQAEVADIYRTRYWDVIHGDQLPEPLDMIVFDAAVNMGTGTAARMLSLSVGLPPHLTIDPQIVKSAQAKAATAAGAKAIDLAYCQRRILLYHTIVARHPKDAVFLKGWLNRVSAALIDAARIAAVETNSIPQTNAVPPTPKPAPKPAATTAKPAAAVVEAK